MGRTSRSVVSNLLVVPLFFLLLLNHRQLFLFILIVLQFNTSGQGKKYVTQKVFTERMKKKKEKKEEGTDGLYNAERKI